MPQSCQHDKSTDGELGEEDIFQINAERVIDRYYILNGIFSYLDHLNTKGRREKTAQDAFNAVLTISCFDMHDSYVFSVAKTLGLSRNDNVYEAIERAVDMKEDGDMFTLKCSNTRCNCTEEVVALVCK